MALLEYDLFTILKYGIPGAARFLLSEVASRQAVKLILIIVFLLLLSVDCI
jgi:hypothetical protein